MGNNMVINVMVNVMVNVMMLFFVEMMGIMNLVSVMMSGFIIFFFRDVV